MMCVAPFEATHLFMMTWQGAQHWMKSFLSADDAKLLENQYTSTLMQDGQPLVCAGALPIWENRAYVWSLLSDAVNRHNFMAVHRHSKKFLDELPFRRIEVAVDVDFADGHRWVKSLGFKLEAPCMEAFEVDGRNSALYARVRR